MAVIMITHDLGVVAEVADQVDGHVRRAQSSSPGTLDQIFYDPQHPYTWGLLGSLTRVDRPRAARLAQIAGQPPSLITPPKGCPFRPRCPHAFDQLHRGARCSRQRTASAATPIAAGCSPEQKQTLRVVETGEIGLEAPAA